MRVRHKIPSVFSLAMVDVLCCALGCVILLWLINLREAKDIEDVTTAERQLTSQELARAREQATHMDEDLERARQLTTTTSAALASSESGRQNAENMVLDLYDQLEQVKKKRKEEQADKIVVVGKLQGELARSEGRVLNLSGELKAANEEKAKLSAQLIVLSAERDKAMKEGIDKAAVAALVPKMKTDLENVSRKRDEAELRVKDVRTRLDEALDQLEKLKAQVAQLRTQVIDLEAERIKAQLEDKRLRDLVARLEAENRGLREQYRALKSAGDQKFAGLPLTGKNVVFVVDKSGSMVAVGPNEPAPDKWPTVCASVAKVMESLPELEHFQVIVFSDRHRFLLGKDNTWIKYDKATSPGEVRTKLLDLLKAGEVDGGTNLYEPFEIAFRFRKGPAPLDTIYFFSDGLPNSGAGVPAEEGLRLWNGQKNGIDADRMELGRRLGDYLRNQMRKDWNKPLPGQKFGPVRINAVGFYYESADLGAFLWALARDNDGAFVGMAKP